MIRSSAKSLDGDLERLRFRHLLRTRGFRDRNCQQNPSPGGIPFDLRLTLKLPEFPKLFRRAQYFRALLLLLSRASAYFDIERLG